MKAFSTLMTALDETNKTSGKLEALQTFLETAPESDRLWMLALFSGRRPKRTVTLRLLASWAAEVSELPDWLARECYTVVGDFAETVSLLLPPAAQEEDRSLTYWIEYIRRLSSLDEAAKKKAIICAWEELPTKDRYPFHKLITGAMRVGVSQGLLVRALAKTHGVEKAVMSHRLTGNWHPDDTTYQELVLQPSGSEDVSKPYPFFLAHAVDGQAADLEQQLGSIDGWQAEWKWDGIRGQLINRQGVISLWSRGEELVTDSYPEIAVMASRLPNGIVLDGEILAWKDGQPMSFQDLQSRIGRKNPSKVALRKAPVAFMVYDLLEFAGEDLRWRPMSERRGKLEQLVTELGQISGLMLSDSVEAKDWVGLERIRAESRKRGTEGLMLKNKQSSYKVGRTRGGWWKWKVDPYIVDAVMIYAQPGHGRRADLYTDYTFAVWKGEELVTFTKAYSGLTDAEIREVDAWVRKHTIGRRGPVRFVKPELVFEIAFEGIARSGRHKSGIALRFPRMKRWRKDKPAFEADHFSTLEAMLQSSRQTRPELPKTGSLFDQDN